ncbi:hypothetical protein ElyMa_004470300 [Elysia marginata]|uniref:Uncharacterized protein n=1 Tax=Elysia marginata TaxID=1093978 RepID=A0AAV4HHM3_9GAST|nr:hypothetical protein ElyMa_004470300 [Elysia marginata]
MCVNNLSQGLIVHLANTGLEPRTSRSESRAFITRPRAVNPQVTSHICCKNDIAKQLSVCLSVCLSEIIGFVSQYIIELRSQQELFESTSKSNWRGERGITLFDSFQSTGVVLKYHVSSCERRTEVVPIRRLSSVPYETGHLYFTKLNILNKILKKKND